MRVDYCGCADCRTELDAYTADEDESPVWCPGSTFVGPWANPAQLARMRAGTTGVEAWSLPQNPWLPDTLENTRRLVDEQVELAQRIAGVTPISREQIDEILAPLYVNGGRRNGRHTAIPGGRAPDTVRDAIARLQATIAEIFDECSVPVRSWTLGDPEPGTPEPELDDRGRPRPPRPSTTPPMWANNPTRTNRRRNR